MNIEYKKSILIQFINLYKDLNLLKNDKFKINFC